MVSKLRTWLQEIKKHPVATGAVAVALVVVIALIIAEVWLNGTGFNGYYQVTIAHTTSGPSAGTVVRTEVYQPGKALWDWMQLLIIPAVLVVGGFLLNYTTSRTEREAAEKQAQAERGAAEKRAQTEREIALDNQREAALQDYIDKMSELLLEKNLRKSGKDDEVRKIARVRTLTVLPRLDENRKRSVLQFLYESRLIDKGKCIVDLGYADLSNANLHLTFLKGADLGTTNLKGANLSYSYLTEAGLSFADLEKADMEHAHLDKADLLYAKLLETNLSNTDLKEANLDHAILYKVNLLGAKVTDEQLAEAASLKGATMPDGTKHA